MERKVRCREAGQGSECLIFGAAPLRHPQYDRQDMERGPQAEAVAALRKRVQARLAKRQGIHSLGRPAADYDRGAEAQAERLLGRPCCHCLRQVARRPSLPALLLLLLGHAIQRTKEIVKIRAYLQEAVLVESCDVWKRVRKALRVLPPEKRRGQDAILKVGGAANRTLIDGTDDGNPSDKGHANEGPQFLAGVVGDLEDLGELPAACDHVAQLFYRKRNDVPEGVVQRKVELRRKAQHAHHPQGVLDKHLDPPQALRERFLVAPALRQQCQGMRHSLRSGVRLDDHAVQLTAVRVPGVRGAQHGVSKVLHPAVVVDEAILQLILGSLRRILHPQQQRPDRQVSPQGIFLDGAPLVARGYPRVVVIALFADGGHHVHLEALLAISSAARAHHHVQLDSVQQLALGLVAANGHDVHIAHMELRRGVSKGRHGFHQVLDAQLHIGHISQAQGDVQVIWPSVQQQIANVAAGDEERDVLQLPGLQEAQEEAQHAGVAVGNPLGDLGRQGYALVRRAHDGRTLVVDGEQQWRCWCGVLAAVGTSLVTIA
eukprot:scaffold464_cov244-Pinguiococcus_pyrenoidosus.AAC.3